MKKPEQRVVRTRIAGFNHHDGAAKALMVMKPQTRLLLVPEPNNPHDPNAIRVMTVPGAMLGYIPRGDAAAMAERLRDKDVLVRCFKTEATFNSIDVIYQMGDPLS